MSDNPYGELFIAVACVGIIVLVLRWKPEADVPPQNRDSMGQGMNVLGKAILLVGLGAVLLIAAIAIFETR